MNTAGVALQQQIRELLAEGEAGAIERERSTFDQLAGPYAESLVLSAECSLDNVEMLETI